MDLRQEPTVEHLAKLLDTLCACADAGFPQTLHTLRWLIQSSPAALEAYDRLHARRDREPSLIELARVMLAAEHHERYPEAEQTVRWMIARSKPASEMYRQLEQMADDAGLDHRENNWATEALEVDAEVDRLVATLDDWQDAAREIQLDKQQDHALEMLLAVCRARIARADRDDQRTGLERLRRRLQDAARRVIRSEDPEQRLSEIQGALRSMKDPAAALATIEELGQRRRVP